MHKEPHEKQQRLHGAIRAWNCIEITDAVKVDEKIKTENLGRDDSKNTNPLFLLIYKNHHFEPLDTKLQREEGTQIRMVE